jgi:hypothetical protein
MTGTLDVYRDWLGIEEEARPLNHYQILRLKRFEDNPAKIREHYRKLSGNVRKHAGGDFGHQAELLLGELADAVTCLTDTRRKQEYDAALGRAGVDNQQPRSLEEILLGQGVVTPEQITKAQQFCRVVGVDLHEALVQQKAATPDVVTAAYAESLGVPFMDVSQVHLEDRIARQVPAVLARQYSCIPVMLDQNQLVIAAPRPLEPDVEEQLRLRSGRMIRNVIGTPSALNAQINRHYPKELVAQEHASGGPIAPPSDQPRSGETAREAKKRSAKESAAAVEKASKPAKPVEEKKPLTPEEAEKRRRDMTIVAFNLTVMATVVPQVALIENWSFLGVFGGILLATVVAAVTWRRLK